LQLFAQIDLLLMEALDFQVWPFVRLEMSFETNNFAATNQQAGFDPLADAVSSSLDERGPGLQGLRGAWLSWLCFLDPCAVAFSQPRTPYFGTKKRPLSADARPTSPQQKQHLPSPASS
jgi:hypothetical protein